MIEKGTMGPIKKVIGVILMIYGISIFIPALAKLFTTTFVNLVALIIIFAGYVLFRSGKQL